MDFRQTRQAASYWRMTLYADSTPAERFQLLHHRRPGWFRRFWWWIWRTR